MIGAILLGAGFGRRFGSDKRLHPLGEQTVAECTVEKYLSAFDHIRVVVRPEDGELTKKLQRFDIEIVLAHKAHLGMGYSLAAGAAELSWQWAFVALLDMPFIADKTLEQLIVTAKQQTEPAIIRPRLKTDAGIDQAVTSGHPIGWHQQYFNELCQCQGDTGAKHLLARHADRVLNVEVDDDGIIRDIDQPSDVPR